MTSRRPVQSLTGVGRCVVYMGEEDVRRQALNVFRMRMLGAKVVSVTSGTRTLKDAISESISTSFRNEADVIFPDEAMRDWVTNLATTHYMVGSAIGPHPFPTIVRDFQSVIGSEIKSQLAELTGKLPDAVIACVGGGSNAMGCAQLSPRTGTSVDDLFAELSILSSTTRVFG